MRTQLIRPNEMEEAADKAATLPVGETLDAVIAKLTELEVWRQTFPGSTGRIEAEAKRRLTGHGARVLLIVDGVELIAPDSVLIERKRA